MQGLVGLGLVQVYLFGASFSLIEAVVICYRSKTSSDVDVGKSPEKLTRMQHVLHEHIA